jgi:hypothetical protein
VNRRALERYLRTQGCAFDHEGGKHAIWVHLQTQKTAPVPRHTEIKTPTVRDICRKLGVPPPSGR